MYEELFTEVLLKFLYRGTFMKRYYFIFLVWKHRIFFFSASLCIMNLFLLLSAFAIVRLFCSSRVFICFILYCCLLCSVLCVFVSVIFIIFLAARYPTVFFFLFVSNYLMPFSVSIINAFIKFFGFFPIRYSNPTLKVFIFCQLCFICFTFIVLCVECVFNCLCVMVNVRFVS